MVSLSDQLEYKYCQNYEYDVCNWVLEASDPQGYCTACQLNRTIPNLSEKKNFRKWRNLEIAKHRLVYQLQKIGLVVSSKLNQYNGLCFDFVAKHDKPHIMTGHDDGVITILLREADSVLREQTRKQLLEPYRTLIGHLRHEVGHYFWDQLVYTNYDMHGEFRALFGYEEADYAKALKRHYKEGAPANWRDSYISKYAAAHPWEDWAETWAHYFHVMDMLETAHYFGARVSPLDSPKEMIVEDSVDPYRVVDFDQVIQRSVPLSFAVNSINRSMGMPDVYPFVITPAVIEKMRFIHHLLLEHRNTDLIPSSEF